MERRVLGQATVEFLMILAITFLFIVTIIQPHFLFAKNSIYDASDLQNYVFLPTSWLSQ